MNLTVRRRVFSWSRVCYFRNIVRTFTTELRKKDRQLENDDGSGFEKSFAANHIETTSLQKFLLTMGSAVVSLYNPSRGDMIAILGETSGEGALKYMLHKMETHPEGQEILKKRPRINSKTVDLTKLEKMPPETLGRIYFEFLEFNKVTPDSRLMVQFVDDVNLAYVLQRYREVHDLIHAILKMPTNMLGEVTVKWVEALQTRLPMCIGGALFGPLRLAPKQRQKYIKYNLPWAIKTGSSCEFYMNFYFENRWEQPLDELYKDMKITPLVVPK